MNRTLESTVSLRWLVPFMRVVGQSADEIEVLANEGMGLRELADPEARIRHRAASEWIGATAKTTPDIGLTAGHQMAPADFDSLELAARYSEDLRSAIQMFSRYAMLMHGAQEMHLIEEGDRAIWELRITDDVQQPAASNDFALAAAFSLCQRYLVRPCHLREVHLRHGASSYAASYARVFPGALLRFGQRHNALVFDRACLNTQMALAHAGLRAIYEAELSARLTRMHATHATSQRVRQVLEEQLRSGDVGIAVVAGRLGVNVSALRRELSEEGTTYRKLREELRAELAERYLRDKALSVSEVAFMLGFATVAAFSKAFRRGHAVPPSAYRANVLRSPISRVAASGY